MTRLTWLIPLLLATMIFALSTTCALDVTDTYTVTETIEYLQTTTHFVVSIVPSTYDTDLFVTITATHYDTHYTTLTNTTTIPTGTVIEVYTTTIYTYTFTNYVKTIKVVTNTYTATVWRITYTNVTAYTPITIIRMASSLVTVTGGITTVTRDATHKWRTVTDTSVVTRWRTATETTIFYSATISFTPETLTTFVQSTQYTTLYTVTVTTTATATYFILSISTVTTTSYGTSETLLIVTVCESTYTVTTSTITSTMTEVIGIDTFIILNDTYTLDEGIVLAGYRLATIVYIGALGIIAYTLLETIFLFAMGRKTGRDVLNAIIIASLISVVAIILDYVLGIA